MKSARLLFIIFIFQLAFCMPTLAQPKQFKALLLTTTRGWHHESISQGVLALQDLARKNFFDLVLLEDPNGITDKNLQNYQVVIFLNTTGDIFDSAQLKVMERFIQAGKGFVGIHSASDTEYGWEWYTKLVGRMFHIHPMIQTAVLDVVDPAFPGLQGFAGHKLWTDEWYEFGPENVPDLKYILAIDESSYNPKADWGSKKGVGMGKFHPIAWYHNYDGGRSFYTALGHMPTDFTDPIFLSHVYAGIFWAATGKK